MPKECCAAIPAAAAVGRLCLCLCMRGLHSFILLWLLFSAALYDFVELLQQCCSWWQPMYINTTVAAVALAAATAAASNLSAVNEPAMRARSEGFRHEADHPLHVMAPDTSGQHCLGKGGACG